MSNSSPQDIYADIQACCADIKSRLQSSDVSELSRDVQAERKKLNEASGTLPARDRRTLEDQMQGLERSIESLRSKESGRSKFSFKKRQESRKSDPAQTPNEGFKTVQDGQPNTPAPDSTGKSVGTKDYVRSQFITRSKAFNGTGECILSNLDRCIVSMLGPDESAPLSSVHVSNVRRSILLLGGVEGSVLMYDVEDCIVLVACHQLRVHASHGTRFFLHVTSNAIIEDCKGLSFSPYPESFPLAASIRSQPSRHLAVQDFSHLLQTASPNWRGVVTEASSDARRREDEAWSGLKTAIAKFNKNGEDDCGNLEATKGIVAGLPTVEEVLQNVCSKLSSPAN